jgi:23S rRNA-/tRNA-specific pseudouridylate synthase
MTAPLVVRRTAGWAVAWKPAGVVIDADPQREPDSFRSALARALALPFRSCHPHTRVDLPVAGLTLWSLRAETRRSLVDATRCGAVRKLYFALAAHPPALGRLALPPPAAPWRTRAGRPLVEPPETIAATVAGSATAVLVAAGITAGKWHQIRLHLAAAGAPAIGDRRHGGPPRVVRADGAVFAAPAVALEAVALEFPDGARTVRIATAPRSFLAHAARWAGIPDEALSEAAVDRAWQTVWPPPEP